MDEGIPLGCVISIKEHGIYILERCIANLECMKNKNDPEEMRRIEELISLVKNGILNLKNEIERLND